MGKTPGKWIKTLLLGKKSPKSNLGNRSENLESAKKDELVESVVDDFSNLSVDPPVVSSQQQDPVTTNAQNVVSTNNGDESKVNLESRNELQQAVIKVQATFRAHQARRAFRTLKSIIRLQAVIRGHLVRRQAIATYSCIWGIVKFQALVRGHKARYLDSGIQFKKTPLEPNDSVALRLSSYSWMYNPTKFLIVDKLLASSPSALPLKIQYGPEEPNSAEVWLQRWTRFQVWSPGAREARILIPKSKTKKRNYQAVVESEKARPKRGVKKQSDANSGNGSTRLTTESEKRKRNARKASALSKDPLRTESDKAKHNSIKSRSTSKKGSPLEVKDEKPKRSLKSSSLSNGSDKASRKYAEKKKDTTADSVQIEPEVKVSDVLEGGDVVESAEKEKDSTDVVPKESGVKKEEDVPEEYEHITSETSDKGEDPKCSHVKLSSENSNVGSDNTKPGEIRVSLPEDIDKQDDEHTHNGRKNPSYMAPTASAKARVKGEGSLRVAQEKTEKNRTLRLHSLPSPANGKLSTTTMSPRAHRLFLASAKRSISGNKSLTSSKDISEKSTKTEWKR